MYSISFQEESLLPRERLVRLGAEQLSNQELLSILISFVQEIKKRMYSK